MSGDLTLLVRSLPYLRPSQIPQRAGRLLCETALISPIFDRYPARPRNLEQARTADSPRRLMWEMRPEETAARAEAIARGIHEWMGVSREYETATVWNDPTVPRLWLFQLHSFDSAWPLTVASSARFGPLLATSIEDWIRSNPPRRGDAWHPFVIAERLINLLGTREAWADHVAPGIRTHLWRQAHLLARILERDIGGNHLMREATALVVAGEAFGDRRLSDKGLSIIRKEVPRQILADGGHFERSPWYHLQVLLDLEEARRSLAGAGGNAGSPRRAQHRMALFAAAMLHPDGALPLFNDSAAWPVPVRTFLERLGLPAQPEAWRFDESGFFRLGDGEDVLFLDAGPPSPPDLPPHAHSDLLSIEVSIEGVRMLTNSGTGDYERGPWRDYWRSTRAHNSVEVDGQDQSETWHSFRMARRAMPREVRVQQGRGFVAITAWHDGYERLADPVRHRRTVVHIEEIWLVIDMISGRRDHLIRSFLHTHPSATVTRADDRLTVRRGTVELDVIPIGRLTASVEECAERPVENWFSEHLGSRTPSRAIVMEGWARTPIAIGWALVPARARHDVILERGTAEVTAKIRDRTVRIRPAEGTVLVQ